MKFIDSLIDYKRDGVAKFGTSKQTTAWGNCKRIDAPATHEHQKQLQKIYTVD